MTLAFKTVAQRVLASPTASATPAPNKTQVALWVGAMLLSLFLSLRNYQSFQIGVYQDDSEYSVLAYSLVQSPHYGLINLPESYGDSSTRYPFGYPLALAPFAAIFPNTIDALKIPALLATLLNATLLFWFWPWFSRSPSYWWGLAVTGLYILTPLTVGHTRGVMSEPVHLTALLATILLTERACQKPLTVTGALAAFALGACMVFAVFVRTIGVILVAVCILYLIALRGKEAKRDLLYIATGFFGLLALVILVTPVSLGDIVPLEYVNQFFAPSRWNQSAQEDNLALRVWAALQQYGLQDFRQIVIPIGGGAREQALAARLGIPNITSLWGLAVSSLIAVGYALWARARGLSVALVFSVLYVGVLLVWPWRGPRFLYAIQPQFYFALLLSVFAIASWVVSRFTNASPLPGYITAVFVIVLLALNIFRSLPLDNSRLHTGDLSLRTTWLRDHSDPAAIVMSEEPQTDYLYSHRLTVPYQNFNTSAGLQNYLSQNSVSYVLIAPALQWLDAPSTAHSLRGDETAAFMEELVLQGNAELIYSDVDGGVEVYRVGE